MSNHRQDKNSGKNENQNVGENIPDSTSEDIAQIFFGKGSEEITDKLVEELVAKGVEREGLLHLQKEGFRYNRSRDSFIEGKPHFEKY
jgi:hypothetical protein